MKYTFVLLSSLFLWSCGSQSEPNKTTENVNTEVSDDKKNSFLAHEKLATTHFDLKQSDNFEEEIKRGVFNVDPSNSEQVQRVVGGPVNIITLKSTTPGFWWALATDRVTYVDAREGKWEAVHSYMLPKVSPISQENLDAILSKEYTSSEELSLDYDKYWAPSKMQNPTLRMMTGNSIYATVDRDNNLYLTASGQLLKLALKGETLELVNSIDLKNQMAVPNELQGHFPIEKIPGGITGVNMSYDGHLIVGTIFGLIAVDRDLNSIIDNVAFPIQYFFSSFPPQKDETPEFISNSFSIDENNGIYVATGSRMNKVVWNGSKLSMEEKVGAWSEPYDTGDLAPTIKYGKGTGSTPTIMDVADDRLVVITDGANRMNLTAFWRDKREGSQLADNIEVKCGFENSPEFIQSEQSVATLTDGAFVVNNIAPSPQGLRKFDEANNVSDLMFNVLSVGPIVEAGKGVERFKWNSETDKWESVWSNSGISSTSMVPAVSSTSKIVLVNTYDNEKGWQVLGMDWTTGEIVHEVNMGKSSFGNGSYALIEYFENGDLLFNGIGGPMRIKLNQ